MTDIATRAEQAKPEETRGLLEALISMVREASMLLQNAEGCAANHYGNDIELHGEPQWTTDSRARIKEQP